MSDDLAYKVALKEPSRTIWPRRLLQSYGSYIIKENNHEKFEVLYADECDPVHNIVSHGYYDDLEQAIRICHYVETLPYKQRIEPESWHDNALPKN
jgi:hypothetical protein